MNDARIPVRLGQADAARPGEWAFPLPPPARLPHAAGCVCCGGVDTLAAALRAGFLARARGEAAWFAGVLLIGPADQAARVAAVLAGDPVMRARFRLTECDGM